MASQPMGMRPHGVRRASAAGHARPVAAASPTLAADRVSDWSKNLVDRAVATVLDAAHGRSHGGSNHRQAAGTETLLVSADIEQLHCKAVEAWRSGDHDQAVAKVHWLHGEAVGRERQMRRSLLVFPAPWIAQVLAQAEPKSVDPVRHSDNPIVPAAPPHVPGSRRDGVRPGPGCILPAQRARPKYDALLRRSAGLRTTSVIVVAPRVRLRLTTDTGPPRSFGWLAVGTPWRHRSVSLSSSLRLRR